MSAAIPVSAPEQAVLRLAIELLASEIDSGLLAVLQEPGTAAALAGIEPRCKDLLHRPWDESDFDTAAAEYCRLFLLNPVAPPRAAAWVRDEAGEHSLSIAGTIQAWIDDGALSLAPPFDAMPPDHVALLLLILLQVTDTDPELAADFRTANLAPWLSEFTTALHNEATHPLYILAACLIEAVCTPDDGPGPTKP